MSHIFISYSRKDIDFAQRIVDALAANDLDTWIDWKSIPKGEDWEQEIYRGIEEADAFLFLVSPDSVTSQMCNKEIAHAVENGKRILPVFIVNVDVRDVNKSFLTEKAKDEIIIRNYLFCREGFDDFDKAIEEIQKTIHTDYDWLKYHTKLQVKALDWERHDDNSRLMRGKELREAEQQFAVIGSQQDPQPTILQRKYILSSLRNQQKTQRRVNTFFAFMVVILIATTIVSTALWQRELKARDQSEAELLTEKLHNRPLINGKSIIVYTLIALEEEKLYPAQESEKILRDFLDLAPMSVANFNINDDKKYLRNQAISGDGKLITDGNTVWETSSGREFAKSPQPIQVVRSTVFSSDGIWVVSAGTSTTLMDSATIVVWDIETNKEIAHIDLAFPTFTGSVALSPDKQFVAAMQNDGTCQVYELSTGKVLLTIEGQSGTDFSWWDPILFSQDGKALISGSPQGIIQVWDISSGHEISRMKHAAAIDSLTLSPNGKYLASGGDDGVVKIWDLDSGQELSHMIHNAGVWSMAFSPEGRFILTASNDGTARVWIVNTGLEVARMVHDDDVRGVGFSADRKLAITSSGGRVWIWKLTSRDIPLDNSSQIAITPQNDIAVTSDDKGLLTVWNLNEGVDRMHFDQKSPVTSFAFSSDGKFMITGDGGGTAHVWDLAMGKEISALFHGKEITSVAISPDDKLAISGSGDGTARVWDVNTGREISRMTYDGEVTSVAFSSNMKWAVSAGCLKKDKACSKGILQMWNIETDQLITKDMPDASIYSVFLSPDGKRMVSTGFWTDRVYPYAYPVRLWNMETGTNVVQEQFLYGEEYRILSASFSPDGRWVGATSDNGKVYIWDVRTGETILSFESYNPVVRSIFSANGELFAAGDTLGSIRVVDVKTGAQKYYGNIGTSITAVNFSPDGSELTFGNENTIKSIRLSYDYIRDACQRLPRNLTEEEWGQFFGKDSYHPTCSNLPTPNLTKKFSLLNIIGTLLSFCIGIPIAVIIIVFVMVRFIGRKRA